MWRIFKAEFKYNANIFVPGYLIISFISAIEIFFEPERYGLSIVSLMVFVVVFFLIVVLKAIKEKRERFYASLPVTVAKIGLTRLLLLLVLYFSMTLVWLFPYFIEYSISADKKLWSVLASNFLMLSSLMFSVIFNDLRFYPVKKYRLILFTTVILYFAMLMFLVVVMKLFVDQKQVPEFAAIILNWPVFAIICIVSILISIYWSVIFFTKRNSFLDEGIC